MPRIDLRVHIAGIPAGTLRQDEHGRMSFEYDIDYAGIPLSISMPIANRTYGQNVVRPYLFGLLPDDERQRRMIAQDLLPRVHGRPRSAHPAGDGRGL